MACEGQLAFGTEDADLDAVAALGCGIAREDESGFLKGGFPGESEHVGVGEAAGVGEDDELVAGEAMGCEDVDLYVREAASGGGWVWRCGGVVGQRCGCCGSGDGAKECASSEFHWRRIVASRTGWDGCIRFAMPLRDGGM